MAWLANLDADARGERGGQAELRSKYSKDEWIAAPHQLDAAAYTHAEHLEALHFLVVGFDAPHDGTDARRQLVQASQGFRGMVYCCHSMSKISFPDGMSNTPSRRVDAIEAGLFCFLSVEFQPAEPFCACDHLRFFAGGLRRQKPASTLSLLFPRRRGVDS